MPPLSDHLAAMLKQQRTAQWTQRMAVRIMHARASAQPLPGRDAGYSAAERARWEARGARPGEHAGIEALPELQHDDSEPPPGWEGLDEA